MIPLILLVLALRFPLHWTWLYLPVPMIGLFRNGRLERSSLGAKPRQQIEAELGMLVIP